jgi:perosamine synthetase
MEINDLCIASGATIADAMRLINKEATGVCFVVDGRRLIGTVTDGDIRRSLLEGMELDSCIDLVMKRDYFSLPTNSTIELIQQHIFKYEYIPIINTTGELVDLATPSRYHQIPLIQPIFDGNELEYVTECIRTGWISSQGKYVRMFEESFSEYVGCPYSLAVSNGTVALHLALVTLGIGPGDEVIVPDLTFAAPVNAVLYVGATPVLVDVDPVTMAIDADAATAAITDRTRAIIPVHLYGHPADMTKLMQLAEQHDLLVIEDCAEALGSRYGDAHVGNFGHASTFSFYGNKTITTGEGGMVLFRDAAIRERAKILRDHGMSPDRRYWHNEVGFNYRLTNIQAAIGLAQLERIGTFIDRKRWIADQYKARLSGIDALQLPTEQGKAFNSYWLYTVVLDINYVSKRNSILDMLKENGIEARPVFFPLHRMPPYERYSRSGAQWTVANHLSDGGISLPSSVHVTENELQRVCSMLITAIASCTVS